jgi:EAL domain-containing protein (putative c-di-GMP-specific phosphodiesterase class I)
MRGCSICTQPLGFEFTMAFQPIVDVAAGTVFAHEALVRGPNGEGAADVLARVTPESRYAFDRGCRVKAVELAARLGMTSKLSINFLPNAVYDPDRCLATTLEAAARCGFPLDRIIFEVTENERVADRAHLRRIFHTYRRHGFGTAIDDFGAGYAGLNLLADYQPDIVKLDMLLIRGIHLDAVRRAIVAAMVRVCRELGIEMIAEGVESVEEARTLASMGIALMQGYLFARPAFEALPAVATIAGLAAPRSVAA